MYEALVCRAMRDMSLADPLNEKAVLRETTDSADTLPRSVMMSSVIPSLKYSCSGSPLMLLKGRTQMDTEMRSSFGAVVTLGSERLSFASSAAHRAWNGALSRLPPQPSISVVWMERTSI